VLAGSTIPITSSSSFGGRGSAAAPCRSSERRRLLAVDAPTLPRTKPEQIGGWMIPVGLLVLSVDVPAVRRLPRKFAVWWHRRKEEGEDERDP
jgi:hypothetical protein